MLEGFHASSSRPSHRDRVRVKPLGRLEAVAWWDRGRGILVFWINIDVQFGKVILVALTVKKLNFDDFKSGGLHEKHTVATWNLGTISAFHWRQRETKKTVCRDGRSQGLPDAYWLLASNPANRSIWEHICCCCIDTINYKSRITIYW
jgi:hypothetical protein